MNRQLLSCDKQKNNFQIGQSGSIADYKSKLEKCFNCYCFITCENSQEYLKGILKQQNNIISLNNINKIR
jgi:hypothetical protein